MKKKTEKRATVEKQILLKDMFTSGLSIDPLEQSPDSSVCRCKTDIRRHQCHSSEAKYTSKSNAMQPVFFFF